MHKIAVFASGSGTNAENLVNYFADSDEIEVTKIYSNRADAFVHERAKNLGIPSDTFSRFHFKSEKFTDELKAEGINCIVLAGFLWLIPETLINAFHPYIINIHPSLLPAFGGKGMYGSDVHEAVIASQAKESGITIHLVNEKYDEGKHLFQARTAVTREDDADSLAKRIHELEYEHFPRVIENYLLKRWQNGV